MIDHHITVYTPYVDTIPYFVVPFTDIYKLEPELINCKSCNQQKWQKIEKFLIGDFTEGLRFSVKGATILYLHKIMQFNATYPFTRYGLDLSSNPKFLEDPFIYWKHKLVQTNYCSYKVSITDYKKKNYHEYNNIKHGEIILKIPELQDQASQIIIADLNGDTLENQNSQDQSEMNNQIIFQKVFKYYIDQIFKNKSKYKYYTRPKIFDIQENVYANLQVVNGQSYGKIKRNQKIIFDASLNPNYQSLNKQEQFKQQKQLQNLVIQELKLNKIFNKITQSNDFTQNIKNKQVVSILQNCVTKFYEENQI